MKFFTGILALGVVMLLAGSIAPAAGQQQKDSIWQVEWHRYYTAPSGTRYGDETYNMWIDGNKVLLKVANERYVSVVGDSIFMIDTFHTAYSSGPRDQVEMLWVKENLIRHRPTAPPMRIVKTGQKKLVEGYEAEEWLVYRTIDNKFVPVEEKLLVTNQLPLPDSLLKSVYLAYSIIEAGMSIDRVALFDTLAQYRLLPLRSDWHPTITSDSAFWYTTQLVEVRKTVVEDGFFMPPPGYTYQDPNVPSTEILWMYKMIPMPGGSREKK